ncbi:endonuclease/exonuclease/phosphatase family protein [Streptomyces mayteni]
MTRTALVGVTTLVVLEILRLAGTAFGDAATVGLPLVVASAALGAGPVAWWLGRRRALPAALGALAALRLLIQLPALRSLFLVALATALAVVTLLLAARRAGARRTGRAVALAVAADVALRLPLDLVDPIRRGGLVGWTVALLLVAALGFLARGLYPTTPSAGPLRPPAETVRALATAAPWGRPGGRIPATALLGPAVGLYAALLASPGYLAGQADLSTPVAGLWTAVGALLGVAVLSLPTAAQPDWAAPAVPVALAVGVLGLVWLPAWAAVPAALLAVAALLAALRRALPLTLPGPVSAHAAAAALAATLLALQHRPPFPLWLFPVLAALAVAWVASRVVLVPTPLPRPFLPVVLATLLLAAPPLTGALRAGPEPLSTDTAGGMYRLLSWNVHQARARDGELDPGAVLDVIRDSRAQVVLLQEVPRGRVGSGGFDLVGWLERRLDVTAVWSPERDRQTGNVILTSLPVLDSATGDLASDRSYAAADLRLTDGETARVVTAHGSPFADVFERLLDVTGDGTHTVLAGDLNALPGSAEIEATTAAGLHSAQDQAPDPELRDRDTAVDPDRRVDWILGARDISFGDFGVEDTEASDHLPLTVTVYLD